ncbi:hypothetical protein, partial [Undibacterium luofuense]
MKNQSVLLRTQTINSSRLPARDFIDTKIITRRENRIGPLFPDGIAYPKDRNDIHKIFHYSKKHRAQIVVNPCMGRI